MWKVPLGYFHTQAFAVKFGGRCLLIGRLSRHSPYNLSTQTTFIASTIQPQASSQRRDERNKIRQHKCGHQSHWKTFSGLANRTRLKLNSDSNNKKNRWNKQMKNQHRVKLFFSNKLHDFSWIMRSDAIWGPLYKIPPSHTARSPVNCIYSSWVEGGYPGCPGSSAVISQPLDSKMLPWLAIPTTHGQPWALTHGHPGTPQTVIKVEREERKKKR
mgnify:CR=1 FL=1